MSGSAPWVLATRNAGKLRELRALLADEGIPVVDLAEAGVEERQEEEDAVECHATFEENALAKARYYSSRLPGRTVLADDSGLVVRALGGAPGVRSRRWSGRGDLHGAALDEANNARLLSAVQGIPDRRASFVCAAAWVGEQCTAVTRGEVAGTIVDTPSGAHGFGYDPHFHVGELGMTLADASVAGKQRVSHRGRAFVSLISLLRTDGRLG